MSLFTPDLFRNFGIGFVVTALALALITFDGSTGISADLSSPAQAAQPAPDFSLHGEVAEEFLIVPIEEIAQ
ncbi:MAG: hypothetical protein AAF687_01305 [Pseudomonadota bacterium]